MEFLKKGSVLKKKIWEIKFWEKGNIKKNIFKKKKNSEKFESKYGFFIIWKEKSKYIFVFNNARKGMGGFYVF
ncbi:hypothetical protein [Clostridioides difficile]|uniref:hypothetical protein n=1 Tax=Clostridioides difficile TaxID=1496 RepID=UPI0018DC5E9C|nr:hypothetical protein [Clostridioides difficile]MBH9822424.1 hypothetical protein [Clostridioides difficile]